MAKVLVGLSGGVDSSAAAAMLIEQGHEVAGAFMKNWINAEGLPAIARGNRISMTLSRWLGKLGIEFRVVDLIDQYKERIVDYLVEGYRQGITPNPDVWCNREMKFGVFLDYALEQGFEAVATGHYARKRTLSDGHSAILRGRGSEQGPKLLPRADDRLPSGPCALSRGRVAEAGSPRSCAPPRFADRREEG